MKKTLQVFNGVAFISVVIINYLSNTGLINNTTIGTVSANLRSLFTPASYAFSIWGLIYLLLLGFIIYQGRSLFVTVKNDAFIEKTGVWFVVSCLANSAWVFCWLYGFTAWSCVCILLLLFSLLKIIWNNQMQLYKTSFATNFFVRWPFVIYSGWVSVASIANIAAYLVKIDWDGFGISAIIWTKIMIIIAVILNLFVTWKRNMNAFALVGSWALIAIGVANKTTESLLATTAFVAAGILLTNSLIHFWVNTKKNVVTNKA